MKIRHMLLALPMLLFACNDTQQPEILTHIDLTETIAGDAQKIPLNDWAKNIRFVPLETNDDILIKYISMVFQRGDQFLVSHGDRVSLLDYEGNYLYDIGSKGQGPTNFISVNNVTLHNDLIYIHETENRIKAYDWKGNFVKKMELPAKSNGLITMDGKEEMLTYVPNLPGDEPTRFYLLKGEEVMDSIANPFIFPKAAFSQMFFPEFQPTQGTLKGFLELHSDTLYKVNEKWETSPYMVINIGKYQPTREERYGVVLADVRKNPMKGKLPMLVTGEVNDKVYMYSKYIQADETFCYDKKTQVASKLLITYPANTLDIPENAAFKPKAILNNKYLADWEQPDNDENPILVVVEP